MLSSFLSCRAKSFSTYGALVEYLSSKEAKENYRVLGKWLGFIIVYFLTIIFLIGDLFAKSYGAIRGKFVRNTLDNPEQLT